MGKQTERTDQSTHQFWKKKSEIWSRIELVISAWNDPIAIAVGQLEAGETNFETSRRGNISLL